MGPFWKRIRDAISSLSSRLWLNINKTDPLNSEIHNSNDDNTDYDNDNNNGTNNNNNSDNGNCDDYKNTK